MQAITDVTLAEARAIAKEAYVYGFPMVDNYRIQCDYFVNSQGPQYKAPWNQLVNTPRVYTPADTAIQTSGWLELQGPCKLSRLPLILAASKRCSSGDGQAMNCVPRSGPVARPK